MTDWEQQREILAGMVKIVETAIARVWTLEAMLDQSQIPNWRDIARDAQVGLAPDVHAQVQPLADAILGRQPQTPEAAALLDWREDVRKLIESVSDQSTEDQE